MRLIRVTSESPRRTFITLYIPEKYGTITTNGREGLIICGDGDVKDGISVGGIFLDGGCGGRARL
jgi:hypothetical protein